MEFQYDFLDDKVYLAISDFRKKHTEQYKLVFLLVKLVDKIMNDEDCKKYNNDREKYIICTIYDCYSTYSSEILLLERGLVSDYRVLLRTFYEKKFKLFAVIKSKRNYNKVIAEQEYYSTYWAKQILENKNHIFDDFIGKIKEEDYDFENYENKKMSIESWANNASLKSEYNRQYSLLSENTHYGIGSLVEKLQISENDKVTYLSFSYDNFDENLITASYEMFKCIEKFLDFMNCEKFKYQLLRIDKQFRKLVKQHQKNEGIKK